MAIVQNKEILPSEYADELGVQYTASVEATHKKKLGQYFTPIEVATFMASYYEPSEQLTRLRILDPGCGLGILSCALCERLVKYRHITDIELVVFETDLQLIDIAHKTLTYLQNWLRQKGVNFTYFLCANDFVLHNTTILSGGEDPAEFFDVVITNPPYFKIPKDDPINKLVKNILFGQQNIYSIFLVISTKLLRAGGTLVFISPRSFTSGNYFRTFREFIFRELKIHRLHLFHSRKQVFNRDKVLQENVIVSCRKRIDIYPEQFILPIEEDYIDISISDGANDLMFTCGKRYVLSSLVNLDSYQKIFHLPTSVKDEVAISIFKGWQNSFSKSKIKISTGPVVSFRSKSFLLKEDKMDSTLLIWLNNVSKMKLTWPLVDEKRDRPQFIKNNKESKALLIENQNLVIIRRFSSKDDASKLISAPYFKAEYPNYNRIGLENHVNYLYGEEHHLSDIDIWGIASLLNSSLFDVYFRTFNGNINVSATELRDLPLPDMDIIHKLGKAVIKATDLDQEKLDQIVNRIFKLKK